MTTIADVLAEIKRQLVWIGPAGRGQGHIVLSRDMAEYARDLMLRIIIERDELVQEVALLKGRLEKEKTPATGEGQVDAKA